MTETTDYKTTPHVIGIDNAKAPEPSLGNAPITGDRYTSTAFMELEWERMWTRVWLIGGLESEVPEEGDFITFDIGRESILCARGKDGRVRAFYNVCQHRGNRLVQTESGWVDRFACAYHGWQYQLDGKLSWVPDEEDFLQGSPCGKLSLVEIPCETWGGFIWYNMDPNCIPLKEYLSPIAEQLETYRMQDMVRTHWITLEGDFNWKCVQDNFNESYHIPFVHPQIVYFLDETYQGCQFDLYDSGHCRMLMPGGGPSPRRTGDEDRVLDSMRQEMELWELDPEDFRGRVHDIRSALQAQRRKLGGSKGFDFSRYRDEQLTDNYHYTVFPNVSFSMKPDGVIFLRGNPHPTDPNKCVFDMWYFTLFPKGTEKYYSNSMAEWVSVTTPAQHQTGKVGDISCGPGIDQDVAIWSSQQQGLQSRGYRGDYMAHQERRIRFHHENLDRYLFGTGSGSA